MSRSRDSAGQGCVAICTERVEAKPDAKRIYFRRGVAICTERVEAKLKLVDDFRRWLVAICTERVEAKKLMI